MLLPRYSLVGTPAWRAILCQTTQICEPLIDPERSALMSRVRGKSTNPEMRVRRLAHALGYRFRLHRRNLPGLPDFVFPCYRRAA